MKPVSGILRQWSARASYNSSQTDVHTKLFCMINSSLKQAGKYFHAIFQVLSQSVM